MFQLRPVYEGVKVFIDYKSSITPQINMFYTTPSGKRLVQESLEPMFYPNYSTWGFYKVNRWRKGFDKFIRRCIESGLLDHWKFKTWIEMEKKQRGFRKPIVYKDISPINPLIWDDTQGAFYLVGMGITVSITIFFKDFFLKN